MMIRSGVFVERSMNDSVTLQYGRYVKVTP